ncbi:MAG: MYXO-CTERM sorting domain-containing protein, partial [Myxococcales bacterium]|nr:MYXO-CTERM sorting domain-containing protein [Myxococcales bacterium]
NRDNDCDGEVDEDPATLCTAGAGEICVAGECVTPSGTGGMGAGSGGAGEAPRLVLSGGLCSHSAGPSEDPLGVWLLGAALAGLWRRRRPATRGPRDRGPRDRG